MVAIRDNSLNIAPVNANLDHTGAQQTPEESAEFPQYREEENGFKFDHARGRIICPFNPDDCVTTQDLI